MDVLWCHCRACNKVSRGTICFECGQCGTLVETAGKFEKSKECLPSAFLRYVQLAQNHHGVKVEVVDLGQYSSNQGNSCMFLICAASIADRRLHGYDDCFGFGALQETLEQAGRWESTLSIECLIEEHLRDRSGTLGRMADILRHACCEVMLRDKDDYLPFFDPHALRGAAHAETHSTLETFHRWIEQMRGDAQGDQLVILALSRLLGIVVQPVHQRGYIVPLMDPTNSASSGSIMYWGNDDKHWVWLRLCPAALAQLQGSAHTHCENRARL